MEGRRTESRAKLQEGVVGGKIPQAKYLARNCRHNALETAKGKAGHSCRDAWSGTTPVVRATRLMHIPQSSVFGGEVVEARV